MKSIPSTTNNQPSDEFQLIPRSENLRSPIPDPPIILSSKIHHRSKKFSEKTDDKTEGDRQYRQYIDKQLQEKEAYIKQLITKIEQQQSLVFVNQQAKEQYWRILQRIGQIIHLPELQLDCLVAAIQKLQDHRQFLERELSNLKNNREDTPSNNRDSKTFKQYEKLLIEKQMMIKQLKQQLLASTQNNIKSIFSSESTDPSDLLSKVNELKLKLSRLQKQHSEPRCLHSSQLQKLTESYQELLKEYRKKEEVVSTLEQKQRQFQVYLSNLRKEFKVIKNDGMTDHSTMSLQYKIQDILNRLNTQNNFYLQAEESKFRIFMQQIQELNYRLISKQFEVDQLKLDNQRLKREGGNLNQYTYFNKSQALQKELRNKQKRITELENTIIDHIGSRATQLSINSQESDRQKQVNNVRNLKAIIKDLKQRIRTQEEQILAYKNSYQPHITQKNNDPNQPPTTAKTYTFNNNNATSTSQNILSGVEKVTKDQNIYKLIEDIIYKMIESKRVTQINCECIEMITDTLLDYQDDFPELQGIMVESGIIAMSSNFLPMPFGEVGGQY